MADHVYLLVHALEWESDLPGEVWRARIELYQSSADAACFRCHVWEYRRQSDFGQMPAYCLVDWASDFAEELECFAAPSVADALDVLRRALGLAPDSVLTHPSRPGA